MFRETLPNGNILNSVSYYYFINSNIIMMDKFNEINYPNISKPEIEIIFDKNNKGKIIQRINYNETLSKERNEMAKIKVVYLTMYLYYMKVHYREKNF